MHVYLKDGNQRRWVTDVYLLKGYCPCIGGDVAANTLSDALRMEPAIWCKVLFLESVSIDCSQRMICWTTSSNPTDTEGVDSPNQYSINDECSGYDAEDELFDLARAIINRTSFSSNKDMDDDYELCILRMLHCFILPKITLHTGDMDKVVQARERQAQHIQALDSKVMGHCLIIDAHQTELDKLRERMLPNLEQVINDGQCTQQFLDCLLDDVNREEKKLRKLIDKAQDDVEAAKLQISGGNDSPELNTRLQQARQSRDSLQAKLLAVVVAREAIADAELDINDDRVLIATDRCDESVREYMDKRDGLLKLKDDRNRFLEQKNCALSVREMLDSIMNDLQNKGYSEANDADSQGSRSTDVLQGVWFPEWQKLGERVATIVHNSDHPIGLNFQSFCAGIRGTCQELINMGKTDSVTLVSAAEWFPEDIENGPVFTESPAEAYGMQDFIVDSYRNRLKSLRARLFNHFANVTDLLSLTFNNRDSQFKNRLRLAYEQCFYDQESSFLDCVYELAHHEHVARLETDIKRLKKLPIKLLNLPMKDEWWLEIFEQRVRIASLSSHVVRPSPHLENGHEVDRSPQAGQIAGSYDMIDEFDEEFPQVSQQAMKNFSDTASVRSFFINTVRARSKTFNFEEESSSDDDDEDSVDGYINCAKPKSDHAGLSASAPDLKFSLNDLIENWEKKGTRLHRSLRRSRSKSYANMSRVKSPSFSDTPNGPCPDTFEDHFGPALDNMRDIFKATSPMAKLKCLTASLRKIASKVAELRLREGGDAFSVAVTAEDLLPLLILMMLQMEPYEAAVMWPQLAMTEDLMAPFLTAGCHGWALTEFQMAQRILSDLCTQF